MMSCSKAGQLLEGQLNDELDWKGRLELNAHLLVCSLCRGYRGQAQRIRGLLRGRPTEGLSQEARERIADRLRRAGESTVIE